MEYPVLKRADTVEEVSFTSKKGKKYWVIHQMNRNTYLRLDEQDYFIWTSIDGTKTTLDIVMQYLESYHALPFSRMDNLIIRLRENGFLREDEYPGDGASTFNQKKTNKFWEILYPVSHIDARFTLFYNKIHWLLESVWFQIWFIVISVIGVGYFIIIEPLPSYPILIEGSSHGLALIWIYLGILASAILHECGHALACKYYGRRVNNGGFLLYYGSPCMYIDTTDIWMAPSRSRIIVSLAGPAVNVFIGSICSLTVLVFPDSFFSTDIWRFAFISYALAFFNLNPLLEFDGYYALTDILELPNLRSQAFQYIKSFPVIAFITGREKISREGLIYLIYGISGGIYTVLIVSFGLYTWEEHVRYLADALVQGTYMTDRIISSILLVVLFLPFIIGMIILAFSNIRNYIYSFIAGERKEVHHQ